MTRVKSYQGDGRVIMKAFTQKSAVQSSAEVRPQRNSNPGPHDSKSEALTIRPRGRFPSSPNRVIAASLYIMNKLLNF